MNQVKRHASQREEAAAAQMRQLEESLAQVSNSLVTVTENLAVAKTTHVEAFQVCRAAAECLLIYPSRL